MRIDDELELGLANLWRTKLRTILTTLGVAIGIGALVSMVSFGTGMQKNVVDVFRDNDLFTSLYVTPQKLDVQEAMQGDVASVMESMQEEGPPLDGDALETIRSIPGVELAFPEIRFPVKIRIGDAESSTTLRAVPKSMGRYRPFNALPIGRFFDSDSERVAILSPGSLEKLNLRVRELSPRKISVEDSIRGVRTVPADSILGMSLDIITTVIDVKAVMRNPFQHMRNTQNLPFREAVTRFTVVGIQNPPTGFESGPFQAGLFVPMEASDAIARLGFSSVWNLLQRRQENDAYSSVYVRAGRMEDLNSIKENVENLGFGAFSIADQLEEIKRGFVIFDTALGTVGIIALVVAALGIINTMVMSILERTREIGVMKAIGGSEGDIKGIFFVEAGFIGWIGGIFGLMLGWAVTRIANIVANIYISRQGGPHVDLFYIPLWLILGALGFSILISLLAGLYPAIRAARVDPVEALRHD